MARFSLSCPTPARDSILRLAFFLISAAVVTSTFVRADDPKPPANAPADAAKKPAAKDAYDLGTGQLIRVQLPLTGRADEHLIGAIKRAVDRLSRAPHHDGRRPTLVLELTTKRANSGFGEGTDFGSALSLAIFLQSPEVAAVKTVAYIPRTIKGHGVLVALACDQIIMNPEAEFGPAGIDEDASRPVNPSILSGYKETVTAKRTIPLAIALSMVDRRLEVLQVETDQGTEYVLRDELPALKKAHTIVSEKTIVTPGTLGSITGREGHEYGLLLASDADALARGLALPPAALKPDQSIMEDWRPVRFMLEGPITRRRMHQMETMLGTELKNKINWIGITIDSDGGKLEDCLYLAQKLSDLDPNEVHTVAYVPVNASGGAAILALACDEVIMQPEAHVGSTASLRVDRKTLDGARESIRASLAKNGDISWSMIDAMIDPDIELFEYHNGKTGDTRYFCDEEAKSQPDQGDWQRQARIKQAGKPLWLTSKQAQDLGVASRVVDNYDELKQIYGFDGDIRVAQPNWALEFIEALSSPALAVLLLVIGFVGIYIELHSPGVGIGGFVAAVAFLLFFWSEVLHGTAGWLEVLLFLGGIFCVLLEVLVLPGFAIFGLGGGVMILTSLVLASQTFVLPRTESQMVELRHSLTIVTAASLLVVASSIALRRYLPNTPLFRKLLLSPPPEEELIDLEQRESLADFSHLVGQQGVAATNLMPSGKGEFNGQLIDVIAEGLPIDRGQAIIVVKARANRVLVRGIDA